MNILINNVSQIKKGKSDLFMSVTKPIRQGAGLGLNFGIIKAHGRELKVEIEGSKHQPFESLNEAVTEFTTQLPTNLIQIL